MARLLGVSEDEARVKIAMLHEGFPEIEEFRRKVIDTVANRSPTPFCRTRAGRLRYIPELCPEQWARDDPEAYDQAVRVLRSKYGWMSDGRAANGIRRRGERLVVNYLVQGGARDLLILGMNELRRRINKVSYIYPSYSIVTTVHDEVLIQHPHNTGEEARELLKRCLEEAGPKLGLKVPIVAEPKTGRNWAEVK
jgi:DNA polymerase I-like protein with 3'-5' exonuclease and polymerase domains